VFHKANYRTFPIYIKEGGVDSNTPWGDNGDMDKKVKNRAVRRLKIISGQVKGLERMVNEDKYCVDIIPQSLAAKEALSSFENLMLENHLSTHVIDQMEKGKEKKAVEVGNIFKLGTKYSLPFDLKFKDKNCAEKPVLMGCFGLGISRTLGAIVEVSHDDKGIIWPKSVAPFLVHLIAIEDNKKVKTAAEKLYAILQKEKIEVLYDDRQSKTAGERFAEADLIGIPYRVVVSEKTLAKNSVEVKERAGNSAKLVKISQTIKLFHAK